MLFPITATACCDKVILDGNDDLKQFHRDKLGVYEKTKMGLGNGQIFKLSGKEYYLFRSPSMQWTVRLINIQTINDHSLI